MPAETNLQQWNADIEGLVQRVEGIADREVRDDVLALVRSVMELHGAGLKRMLDVLSSSGEPGRQILVAIAEDELAGSLLLLHGIHPTDIEERVAKAIERLATTLRSQGSGLRLLGIRSGTVRIRLEHAGHGSGCSSTPATLQNIVRDCVYSAAPEVASIEFEDATAPSSLVQLTVTGIPPART
jgi:Fe-S cluster biogenesis protein NfuA